MTRARPRGSRRRMLAVVALLAALAAAGCGGGSTGTGPAGEPTASAPDATAPPPDATQPGTTAVTPPATTQTETQTAPTDTDGTGGAQAGGDGGEQQVRVPAAFLAGAGGRLTPRTITVPPFLAVELSLRSGDGRPHRLVLRTTPPHALRVGAGGRAAVRIAGLRAGRYPVLLDGRRAGALVAGGEVGP
jgi:hypothetical protein